jgi:hypothetical protein
MDQIPINPSFGYTHSAFTCINDHPSIEFAPSVALHPPHSYEHDGFVSAEREEHESSSRVRSCEIMNAPVVESSPSHPPSAPPLRRHEVGCACGAAITASDLCCSKPFNKGCIRTHVACLLDGVYASLADVPGYDSMTSSFYCATCVNQPTFRSPIAAMHIYVRIFCSTRGNVYVKSDAVDEFDFEHPVARPWRNRPVKSKSSSLIADETALRIDVSSLAVLKRPCVVLSNAVENTRAATSSGAAAASWSAEPPMPSSSRVHVPGEISAFVDPHSIKRSNKRKAGVVQRFIDAMEEVEMARSNEQKPANIAKKAAAVVTAIPQVRPPVNLSTSLPAAAPATLATLCPCGRKDTPTRAHRGGLATAPVFILTCVNARVDCHPTHSYCWFKSSTLLLRSSNAMKRIAAGIVDGSMLFVCKRCRIADNQYRGTNEVVREGRAGIVYKRRIASTSRPHKTSKSVRLVVPRAAHAHAAAAAAPAVVISAQTKNERRLKELYDQNYADDDLPESYNQWLEEQQQLMMPSSPSSFFKHEYIPSSSYLKQLHAALIAPLRSAPFQQICSAAASVAATSTSENALAAASASPSGPEATDSTPMGL